MAKVMEFVGSAVVSDLVVQTGEGEFKGAALKGTRYSYESIEVSVESPADLSEPMQAYAKQVLEAAALYELSLHAAKKTLVVRVQEAQAKLEAERKAAQEAAAKEAAAQEAASKEEAAAAPAEAK